MSEMLTTIDEVCGILEKPSSVLILTHTRPDADTLGCAAALREILISLGKRAEIVNDDDIPRRLKFIFGKEPDDEFDLGPERLAGLEPDMIVSVDVSASKLLGRLEEPYAGRTYLAIDHHALGTPFAEKTYVGALGACGEIIC
ncbi:MAG: DHH family phosphoesterase, partial [Candidatus Flemingibacterium sp.]|nr:DHH family phosphoesterase [Candidatus Flemingibacterium sp.]